MNRKKWMISTLFIATLMMSLVIPAFAGRTPKAGQFFVKVVDSNGKGVGKIGVYILDLTTEAKTVIKNTKGNGFVLFDINKDTETLGLNYGGWGSGHEVLVYVWCEGSGSFNEDTTVYVLNLGPRIEIEYVADWIM